MEEAGGGASAEDDEEEEEQQHLPKKKRTRGPGDEGEAMTIVDDFLPTDITESIDDITVPTRLSEQDLSSLAKAFVAAEKQCGRIRQSMVLIENDGMEGDQWQENMLELFVFLRPHPARWWTWDAAKANFFLTDQELFKLHEAGNQIPPLTCESEKPSHNVSEFFLQSRGLQGALFHEVQLLEWALKKHGGAKAFLQLRLEAEELKEQLDELRTTLEADINLVMGLEERLQDAKRAQLMKEGAIADRPSSLVDTTDEGWWTVPAALVGFNLRLKDIQFLPLKRYRPPDRHAFDFSYLVPERELVALAKRAHGKYYVNLRLKARRSDLRVERAMEVYQETHQQQDQEEEEDAEAGQELVVDSLTCPLGLYEAHETGPRSGIDHVTYGLVGITWVTRKMARDMFGLSTEDLEFVPRLPGLNLYSEGPDGDLFSERDLQLMSNVMKGKGAPYGLRGLRNLGLTAEHHKGIVKQTMDRIDSLAAEALEGGEMGPSVTKSSEAFAKVGLGLSPEDLANIEQAPHRSARGKHLKYQLSSLLQAALRKHGGVAGLLRHRLPLMSFLAEHEKKQTILEALSNFEAMDEGEMDGEEEEEENQGTEGSQLVQRHRYVKTLLPADEAAGRWYSRKTAQKNFFLEEGQLPTDHLKRKGDKVFYREDELRRVAEEVHGHRSFRRQRVLADYKHEEKVCGKVLGDQQSIVIPEAFVLQQQNEKQAEGGVIEALSRRVDLLHCMRNGQYVTNGGKDTIGGGPIVWREESLRKVASRNHAIDRLFRKLVSAFLKECEQAKGAYQEALDRMAKIRSQRGLYQVDSPAMVDQVAEKVIWETKPASYAETRLVPPALSEVGQSAKVLCVSRPKKVPPSEQNGDEEEKGDEDDDEMDQEEEGPTRWTIEVRDPSSRCVRRLHKSHDQHPLDPYSFYLYRPRPDDELKQLLDQSLPAVCLTSSNKVQSNDVVYDAFAELILIPELDLHGLHRSIRLVLEQLIGKLVLDRHRKLYEAQLVKDHGKLWMVPHGGRAFSDLVPGPICQAVRELCLPLLSCFQAFRRGLTPSAEVEDPDIHWMPGMVKFYQRDFGPVCISPLIAEQLLQVIPADALRQALMQSMGGEEWTEKDVCTLDTFREALVDSHVRAEALNERLMAGDLPLAVIASRERNKRIIRPAPAWFHQGYKLNVPANRYRLGCGQGECETRIFCPHCHLCVNEHCGCQIVPGAAPNRPMVYGDQKRGEFRDVVSSSLHHEVRWSGAEGENGPSLSAVEVRGAGKDDGPSSSAVEANDDQHTAQHQGQQQPPEDMAFGPLAREERLHRGREPQNLKDVPRPMIEQRIMNMETDMGQKVDLLNAMPSLELLAYIKGMASQKLRGPLTQIVGQLSESALIALGVMVEEMMDEIASTVCRRLDVHGYYHGLRKHLKEDVALTLVAHLGDKITEDEEDGGEAVETILSSVYGPKAVQKEWQVVDMVERARFLWSEQKGLKGVETLGALDQGQGIEGGGEAVAVNGHRDRWIQAEEDDEGGSSRVSSSDEEDHEEKDGGSAKGSSSRVSSSDEDHGKGGSEGSSRRVSSSDEEDNQKDDDDVNGEKSSSRVSSSDDAHDIGDSSGELEEAGPSLSASNSEGDADGNSSGELEEANESLSEGSSKGDADGGSSAELEEAAGQSLSIESSSEGGADEDEEDSGSDSSDEEEEEEEEEEDCLPHRRNMSRKRPIELLEGSSSEEEEGEELEELQPLWATAAASASGSSRGGGGDGSSKKRRR